MQETGEQMDLEEYDHIVFRVYGDGRKYIANMRTENWLVGGPSHDVWQAFLFARYGTSCLYKAERLLAQNSGHKHCIANTQHRAGQGSLHVEALALL